MTYEVTVTKTVNVDAESALRAAQVAAHHVGGKVERVYCVETGETQLVAEHCEGCRRPIFSGDTSGAVWEDGVRTCGDCTALEPGDRVEGRPTLTVVS